MKTRGISENKPFARDYDVFDILVGIQFGSSTNCRFLCQLKLSKHVRLCFWLMARFGPSQQLSQCISDVDYESHKGFTDQNFLSISKPRNLSRYFGVSSSFEASTFQKRRLERCWNHRIQDRGSASSRSQKRRHFRIIRTHECVTGTFSSLYDPRWKVRTCQRITPSQFHSTTFICSFLSLSFSQMSWGSFLKTIWLEFKSQNHESINHKYISSDFDHWISHLTLFWIAATFPENDLIWFESESSYH
jgi:hypothetical protein